MNVWFLILARDKVAIGVKDAMLQYVTEPEVGDTNDASRGNTVKVKKIRLLLGYEVLSRKEWEEREEKDGYLLGVCQTR